MSTQNFSRAENLRFELHKIFVKWLKIIRKFGQKVDCKWLFSSNNKRNKSHKLTKADTLHNGQPASTVSPTSTTCLSLWDWSVPRHWWSGKEGLFLTRFPNSYQCQEKKIVRW